MAIPNKELTDFFMAIAQMGKCSLPEGKEVIKEPGTERYGQYVRLEKEGTWDMIEDIQEELNYSAALSFLQLKDLKKATGIKRYELDARPYWRKTGDSFNWTMGYVLTTDKI